MRLAPRALMAILAVLAMALLGACAKTAPLTSLPTAQAPQWKPGDFWEFSSKSRSAFALASRMEVKSVGEEIVLLGDGDPAKILRLDKDFSVRESNGSLLQYSVASGKDAYVFFPLSVGETRTFTQSTGTRKGAQTYTNTVTVEAAEEITVPAGTFKAFRIRVNKKNDTGWSGFYQMWYAPEVGYFVRIVDTHNNVVVLEKFGSRK
ncbi:MAG: hypothetical protein ACLGSA_08050 [Acidobacteriota bacterium]